FITGSLMRFEPKEYHIEMRKKGKGSAEYERDKRLWSYALMNYRRLQSDIARGGGEHLESFAHAVSAEGGAAIVEHTLRNGRLLAEASGPHDFVYRFNGVLADDPALRVYQM